MDHLLISEQMPVVGVDGQQIGRVDKVEGNAIKLTKSDSPDDQHHFVPIDWVTGVDDRVRLGIPSDQAIRNWMSSPPGEAPGMEAR